MCLDNPSIIEVNKNLIALMNYDIFSEYKSNEFWDESEKKENIQFNRFFSILKSQKTLLPVIPSSLPVNYTNSFNMKSIPSLYLSKSSESFKNLTTIGKSAFLNFSNATDKFIEIHFNNGVINFNEKEFKHK